jgi:endonuclease G
MNYQFRKILVLFCLLVSIFSLSFQAELKGLSEKEVNSYERPLSDSEALKTFLPYGNPSNANTSDPENYLLVNQYMVISYSKSRVIPNWVAWRVTQSDLGNTPRNDSFRPDDRLPSSFPKAYPSDYTGSGYDKGHICPSADRTSTTEANASTFLMTNIAPQTPDLNRGPWERLESYLRYLVNNNYDVYVIAGDYGYKGKIKSKITIPRHFWKIAVVLPKGASPSSINERTRVITVDMPNDNGIKYDDWTWYKTTVRDIERKTGYNFFSKLPQSLQDALETKID